MNFRIVRQREDDPNSLEELVMWRSNCLGTKTMQKEDKIKRYKSQNPEWYSYLKTNLSIGSQQQNDAVEIFKENNLHLKILYPDK